MSFMESLGKAAGRAAKSAYDGLEAKYENIQKYKERNSNLSDEELFKKAKRSSGDEKLACMQLLKERGYGNQD